MRSAGKDNPKVFLFFHIVYIQSRILFARLCRSSIFQPLSSIRANLQTRSVQTRSEQTRSEIGWGFFAIFFFTICFQGVSYAATFNVTGNLTVDGTGGSTSKANVQVGGYSSFATTPTNAAMVTSGNASVYIQGDDEVGGAAYLPNGIWQSNGNLGIGTTNPSANLTVGNNLFQVNSTGDLIKINNVVYSWPSSQGGAGTSLTNNGAGALSWAAIAANGWTRDTSGGLGARVYLSTDTDKIGVGTTGPTAKLDIRGSGTGAGTWALRIADTLGNDKLVVQDDGNFGLGTTAPVEKLHIQDGTLKVDSPANPTQAGIYGTTNAYGVYVSGRYAYVADFTSGLRVIDISVSNSPVQVGICGIYATRSVCVSGRYAYVADWSSGLRLIDVSVPSSPVQSGI